MASAGWLRLLVSPNVTECTRCRCRSPERSARQAERLAGRAAARLTRQPKDQLGGLFWTFDSLARRHRLRRIDREVAFRQAGRDRTGDHLVDVNAVLPALHRESLREYPETRFR